MSTALMYSMAQRADTRVLDEPLYGHFLAHTGAERPCRAATLAAWPTTPQAALDFMAPKPAELSGNHVLFCKHMANHIDGLPWGAFEGHRHVLLFRNPAAVMASYGAHIQRPTLADLCYDHQLELLERMNQAGTAPVVVCSDRLQADPERVLRAMCGALGLDWDPAIMRWQAGARPEDGPWAPWWYDGVHASAGWEARPVRTHAVPPHLTDLHAACEGTYNQLLERAI